ncbi:hypothetical protein Rhow_007786 [Rhodococcus wratislaviensis]|uniref:Uncharacterized protein n=1 Tax=Rhodococcus wratislaviensis TaxID=44752 RepID=A0A402CIV0_RHOWR|nr:hypothetical protein Rhow_007786 [Rhodococcus wratislaviensis]
MFAQEPPPDFDVPGRREPGERPELVAEVGLVEVAAPLARSPRSIGPAGLIANTVAATPASSTVCATAGSADPCAPINTFEE